MSDPTPVLLNLARRRQFEKMLERLPKATPRDYKIIDIAGRRGTDNLAQRS